MENVDHEFYEFLKQDIKTAGMEICVPDDDVISLALSRCELVRYPKHYRIVNEGEINNALFILKKGITRISYYDEDREVTLGIASEPTMSISPLGFVLNSNAHYMVTACSEVEIYRLEKEEFDRLLMESPAFSRWMMGMALVQIAMFEYKSKNLVGSTKDKYQSLRSREYIKKWQLFSGGKVPDIVREVSDRVISSYLDVHPVYLSTIKRELIEEERSKKT